MGRKQEPAKHPETWNQFSDCRTGICKESHAHRGRKRLAHRTRQDEERIEYLDKLHSQDEERFVVLGCVQGVLYVVYTMRGEYARLISARVATPFERRIYYGEE